MFKHACPECGCDLEEYESITDLTMFTCPECLTYWTVCPDCGELTDTDENWNTEQGVCDCCQVSGDNGDLGVTVITFSGDPEEMFEYLEQPFGRPETPPTPHEDLH